MRALLDEHAVQVEEVVHGTTICSNAILEGKGARTVLASPLTAAVCAVAGEITDPRTFLSMEAA